MTQFRMKDRLSLRAAVLFPTVNLHCGLATACVDELTEDVVDRWEVGAGVVLFLFVVRY